MISPFRVGLVVFVASLVGVTPVLAHDDALHVEKAQLDARISGLRNEIDQAKTKEGVLSSDIEAASGEIESLAWRIEALSETLAELDAEVAAHRRRLAVLEERYEEQTRDLVRLRRDHARARRVLEARLVALYQSSTTDGVAVLLQVQSLGELIETMDYITEVGEQDRRLMDDLRRLTVAMRRARERTQRTKAQVAEATAVLEQKAEEERAARAALVEQQNALQEARADKGELLADVRGSRKEDEGNLEALLAASAQLTSQLQTMQASVPGGSPGGSSPGGAATSSSGLIWPVSGVLTSGYGPRGGQMHVGIDIAAPAGTAVRAAAAGRVVIAGWMGGYGNVIVIDHGGGLATAYAHLSSIWVGGGTVSQGQSIGGVGSTGNSTGNHLHFEVRVNGNAVDPLAYL
jgi:murein DD-endopeptidase MepM/ murein hydrolase activator NlpD